MSDPNTSVVKCQCGVKLRVPPNAAGKRIRCPKCEFRIQIPAEGSVVVTTTAASAPPVSRPAPKRAPKPPPVADEGDALLSDLMQAESSAATSAAADLESKQKTCPSCRSPMTKDAQVCVMCGHDLKARPAAAAKGTGKKVQAAAGGAARTGGRFLVGCALSAAGAVVGGLIWFGIAMATEREFGLIAIVVGALAGGGMALGYRTPGPLAGWVAVLTTIAGVVLAKILIFAFVLYAMFTGDSDNIDIQRGHVQYQMLEERYQQEGIWSPQERLKKNDEFGKEIEAEVATWSDAQVKTKWQEYKDAEADFETAGKRSRLADHRATLRVREAGHPPWGPEYDGFYNEEQSKVNALQPAELDTQLAELDAWEAGGQWSDARNVRNTLIYEKAERGYDAEIGDDEEVEDADLEALAAKDAESWKKHHTAAVAEVDALSAEAQLQELRSIEAARQSEIDAANAEFAEQGLDDLDGSDIALGIGALIVVFFLGMFGLFGTVFTVIAAVTAYRVASNGYST